MYENYILDVSFLIDGGSPCFIPYENDELIFGVNIMTNLCPGKLIGVIHCNGQDAVEKWCSDNPNWHETYSKKEN